MVTLKIDVPQPTGANGNGNGAAFDVAMLTTKTLFVSGNSDGSFKLQVASVKAADAVDADFFDAGTAITNKGIVTVNDLALSARLVVSGQGANKSPVARIVGLYATEGG